MQTAKEMKLSRLNTLRENKYMKIFAAVVAAIFPIYAFVMAQVLSFHLKKALFDILIDNFPAVMFSLVIIYVFYCGLFLLTKRAFAAAGITGLLIYAFGVAQYFKMLTLGENLYPWDLIFFKKAANFLDFELNLYFTFYMAFFLVITLLYILFLYFFAPKLKFRAILHIPASLLVFAFLYIFLVNPFVRQNIYPRIFKINESEMFFQDTNYGKNGPLSAFFLNLGSMGGQAPEGYSKDAIEKIMREFEGDTDGEDFSSPDVIAILAEAVWDPTLLENCTFSHDPLANFRQILSQNHGGSFISNTFGGGTVRPEIEFLTGFTVSYLPPGVQPYEWNFSNDTWSYASYFKSLGYETLALHTYNKKFFNRGETYPKLGFDSFKDVSDLETEPIYTSAFVSDDTFANEVIYELEKERDRPLFMFGITMGNHGLYGGKYKDSEIDVRVKSSVMSDEDVMILENFSQGVYEFDLALKKLYDYVNSRDKETVVIVFGDHLPALGAGYSTYISGSLISSGNSSDWSTDERLAMVKTPYLLFSNYDIEDSYPLDGEDISPAFLIANLIEYIGAPKNPMINFLNEFKYYSPVYNRAFGIYSVAPDDEKALSYSQTQRMLSHDLTVGRLWGLKYLINP